MWKANRVENAVSKVKTASSIMELSRYRCTIMQFVSPPPRGRVSTVLYNWSATRKVGMSTWKNFISKNVPSSLPVCMWIELTQLKIETVIQRRREKEISNTHIFPLFSLSFSFPFVVARLLLSYISPKFFFVLFSSTGISYFMIQ